MIDLEMNFLTTCFLLLPIIEVVLIVALRAVRPIKPSTKKYQTWAIFLATAYIVVWIPGYFFNEELLFFTFVLGAPIMLAAFVNLILFLGSNSKST